MGDMMEKVSRLRSLFPDLDIEVDGGVGTGNIEQVAKVLVLPFLLACQFLLSITVCAMN